MRPGRGGGRRALALGHGGLAGAVGGGRARPGVLAVATGFVFADGPSLAAIVVAAAALAAVAGGIRLAGRDAPSAMAAGLAGAVVVFGLLFAVILPRLDGLWLGRSTAALLAREGCRPTAPSSSATASPAWYSWPARRSTSPTRPVLPATWRPAPAMPP